MGGRKEQMRDTSSGSSSPTENQLSQANVNESTQKTSVPLDNIASQEVLSKQPNPSILRETKTSNDKRRSLNKIRFLIEPNEANIKPTFSPHSDILSPTYTPGRDPDLVTSSQSPSSLSADQNLTETNNLDQLDIFSESDYINSDSAGSTENKGHGFSRSASRNSSNRSRTSSVGVVKWKATLSEVADEEFVPSQRYQEESCGSLEELGKFVAEKLHKYTSKKTTSGEQDLCDDFNKIKELLVAAQEEVEEKARTQKNVILRSKSQVERLKEKLEVNFSNDSRLKEQADAFKELSIKNKELEKIVSQQQYGSNSDDHLNSEELLRYKTKYAKLKQKLSSLQKTPQPEANEIIFALKAQVESAESTKEHLIKSNNHLIKMNEQISTEFKEAKERFREEQIQWRHNWELLKKHYEASE